MSRPVTNRRRQCPFVGEPAAPVSPFEAFPSSMSLEFRCTVSLAAMSSISDGGAHPESSVAWISTV